ncbi:hypothetical protein GGX14DRAFT_557007 [Mycena pura]|uniref:Uncharacterized protein n=1 Tax=Mycena pura TaxID=153505 RepID=A0AAD6YN36_9AGAR|nr:hypothetical protein GGX14DRAFT_557007 [Mycena pura]
MPDAVSTMPIMVHGDWVLFHPMYTTAEMRAVEVLHRDAKTVPDKLAWGFDFVSRYKHQPMPPAGAAMTIEELRKAGHLLDKRGIHTCLEKAENERMHLMKFLGEFWHPRIHTSHRTFMTLRDLSIWFCALILGAHGVF